MVSLTSVGDCFVGIEVCLWLNIHKEVLFNHSNDLYFFPIFVIKEY